MARIKRIVEIFFIVIIVAAVLAQATAIFLRWREGKRIREEIWKSARVSVVKTDPQFPPGLLVHYENTGRYTIDKTRFLLVIELNGQEIARTEREYKAMKPGEKESVLLKSVAESAQRKWPPGTKVHYRLLVFPGQRKPLPDLSGEIELH
jgi:hypothetical protein